jgi:hypothetical protein
VTLLWVLLCTFATATAAQEPNGRIDLGREIGAAPPAMPGFAVARISFVENDSQCPEDRGTLRISDGVITQLRAGPLATAAGRAGNTSWQRNFSLTYWKMTWEPIDDETYRYRVTSWDCRMDITVRQQVLRDGAWISLRVPKVKRPSLPWRERAELQQQLSNRLRQQLSERSRANPAPSDPANPAPIDKKPSELAATLRSLLGSTLGRNTTGTLGFSTVYGPHYDFDEPPQSCVEALGDFRIEPNAFVLSFLRPLPGDLNKFVMERTDLDENRSRLHLTRGDCRWELTVSQSLRPQRDTRWIALPLAPVPPAPGIAIPTPPTGGWPVPK